MLDMSYYGKNWRQGGNWNLTAGHRKKKINKRRRNRQGGWKKKKREDTSTSSYFTQFKKMTSKSLIIVKWFDLCLHLMLIFVNAPTPSEEENTVNINNIFWSRSKSWAFEPFSLSVHTIHARQPHCPAETCTNTAVIQSVAFSWHLGI